MSMNPHSAPIMNSGMPPVHSNMGSSNPNSGQNPPPNTHPHPHSHGHSSSALAGPNMSQNSSGMPMAPPPHMSQQHMGLSQHMQPQQQWPKYQFQLKVEQQPVRARMCGFGDKDRRPITPPPCVRLVVLDPSSGREVDYNEIDSTHFVLTVDLWNQNKTSEVNLVRHNSGTPSVSISTAAMTSYPPPPDRQAYLIPSPGPPMHSSQYHGVQHPPAYHPQGQPVPGYYQHPPSQPPISPAYGYPQTPQSQQYMITSPTASTQPAGMFTRNLIGSLAVNASKLKDTEGKLGFWFVLQDLSVRTEGYFCLKMSFVDVGNPENPSQLNMGKAAVQAHVFTEPFQVYSAKKFPGVIESTPLSKAFASQGIKIPIRKDGPRGSNNDDDDD